MATRKNQQEESASAEEQDVSEAEDGGSEGDAAEEDKPKPKAKAKPKKTTKKKATKKTTKKATGGKKKTKKTVVAKSKKTKAEKREVNRVRDQIIEAIRRAGAQGLHSYDLAKITGQTSEKLARQALRKARWDMAEAGYRLAAEKERDEGRYKIYRAVKVEKGVSGPSVEKKLDVVLYPLKTA